MTRKSKHSKTVHGAAIVVVAVMLLAGAAHADAPQAPRERSGLTFGLSLGGGGLTKSCDACDALGSVAVAIRVGWMLSPRLALLYDASAFGGAPDGFGSTLSLVLGGAAQYWVVPRVWVKAGLGLAQLEVKEGVFAQQERSDKGLGVVAAGGYELATLGRFQLELEARGTVGLYEEKPVVGIGALVGVSWY